MLSHTQKELDKFGKYVVSQSRANLTRSKHRYKGKLHKSINYNLKVSKNSFQLDFEMEKYGKFVDKGVQGTKSKTKAPKSPYRFGTGTGKKGGLTESIDKWVKDKRFQFRDKKTGRFWSYAQTSFVIRRSIWFTGLKTTNFFTKPFERAFKKLPKELTEAYALDLDDFFDFAT